MDDSKDNKRILVLFGTYILVLAWAVLWKIGVPSIGDGTLRMVNVTPFFNAKTGALNSLHEMFYNTVIFIPSGLYISLIAPKWSLIRRVSPIFLLSFALEALQYVLAVGRSDVTDLLVNTLGGVIGIAIFALLSRFFGDNARRAMTVIGVVGTILALLTAGYFLTHITYGRPH